ncbi:zeta toxin family protein, partial [Candidatus Kurthia intestinigallinarum]
ISNIQNLNRINILDEILLQYIHKANIQSDSQQKISFFLGGGSNAGKSTFRKRLKESVGNILIIDSDELKKEIPEYQKMLDANPEIAASIVHKESSLMASKLLEKAIEREISHIFDGTLKDTQKYINFIHLLKQAKFEVTLTIIDVPVKIALKRNRIRYEEAKANGDFPRLVPDEIVIQSHSMIAKSFVALKDLVDHWAIVDTQDNSDEVIATGSLGKETILNNKKYQEFLSK